MTDDVIENLAEEVLGTQSKTGLSHLHWLFEFTRALGAPDEVITHATPNVEAIASRELPLQPRESSARGTSSRSAASSASRTRSRPRTSGWWKGSRPTTATSSPPDDYRFHTIHIYVDEEHGGHVGEFAERYLDTEDKRRSARSAYLAGAELTRRCWDAIDGATW